MSKIGNLFKKFLKKKKNSQDLDEIFYDEIDIGEETVLVDSENPDLPLKPHPSQSDANQPAKSDLQFPKDKELDQTKTQVQEPKEITATKVQTPPEGEEIESATREIDISSLSIEEETDDIPEETLSSEEAGDYVYDPRLDLTNTTQHPKEDFEYDEDDEAAYQGEDPDEYVEEEYSDSTGSRDFDYTMASGTFTNEIDLENSKYSFRDKIDHLQMRVVDRFRNIGKKDLNEAMKPPRANTVNDTLSKIDVSGIKNKVNSINWEKLPNDILNISHQQKVHRYFQITLTVLLVYGTANLIGGFLNSGTNYKNAGKGASINIDDEKKLTRPKVGLIKSANVFKTTKIEVAKGPVKKNINRDTKCVKANSKSSLPIKLEATIVLQDSVKSIASVSVRSKKQILREADKISSMARIDKINGSQLIIKNLQNGNCESISNKVRLTNKRSSGPKPTIYSPASTKKYKKELEKVKGIENNGNSFKIDRKILDEKLKDINSLLTEAKAFPIQNPDGTMSFKIEQISPGSVFAALGIANGDVITGINGEPIKNMNEIMGLFGKLSSLDRLNLTVDRDGESITQDYTITK